MKPSSSPRPSSPFSNGRRRFLKTAVLGAGAGALGRFSTAPSYAAPIGANEDVRVAVIGFNSRGAGHIKSLKGMDGVRIAGLCDADSAVIDRRAGDLAKDDIHPKTYTDYRLLCEDPEIDGVVIATPNHLHTVIAMTAIANGKHVYVEKPVSHNVAEGRLLTEAAAARPGLIVQHGMQRRSSQGWAQMEEWMADEPIGKVLCSRGLCYKPRKSIGKVSAPKAPPSTVDYDLWCGPRDPDAPLLRERFHYDWHWQWAYGNGDIGNQGPHQTDVARWMVGNPTGLPSRVLSAGGRFGYDDDGETANTQIAVFEYDDGTPPIIFEVRGLPMYDLDWNIPAAYQIEVGGKKLGSRIGNIVHCEGGFLVETKAYDNDGKEVASFRDDGGGGHLRNWIASMRSGEMNDNQRVEHGHHAAAISHLANISYRLGAEAGESELRDAFSSEPFSEGTVGSLFEHLAANGIDLASDVPTLGVSLEVAPSAERFVGDGADAANAHLFGDYRAGFELPEIS